MPGLNVSQSITYGDPLKQHGRYAKFTLSMTTAIALSIGTAAQTGVTGSFVFNLQDAHMLSADGILIDNTANPRGIWLQVQDTGQQFYVRPFSQYSGPLFTGGGNFTIIGTTRGVTAIPITIFNRPLPILSRRFPIPTPAQPGVVGVYSFYEVTTTICNPFLYVKICAGNSLRREISIQWNGNAAANLYSSSDNTGQTIGPAPIFYIPNNGVWYNPVPTEDDACVTSAFWIYNTSITASGTATVVERSD